MGKSAGLHTGSIVNSGHVLVFPKTYECSLPSHNALQLQRIQVISNILSMKSVFANADFSEMIGPTGPDGQILRRTCIKP